MSELYVFENKTAMEAWNAAQGTSFQWEVDAFATVSAAVAASADQGSVYVAPGNYTEAATSVPAGNNYVSVYNNGVVTVSADCFMQYGISYSLNNSGTIYGLVAESALNNGSAIVTIENSGLMENAQSDTSSSMYVLSSATSLLLTNQATGVIRSVNGGAIEYFVEPAYSRSHKVDNSGLISGATYGIYCSAFYLASSNSLEYTIENKVGGTITGGTSAIQLDIGGTAMLTNSGTINGNVILSAGADLVTLNADSVLNGALDFKTGADTLVNHSILSSALTADALTVSGTGSFSGTVTVRALTVDAENVMTLSYGSLLKISESFSGTIAVDVTGAAKGVYKVIDYTGTGSAPDYSGVTINGSYSLVNRSGDLFAANADMSTLKVNSAWATGYEIGDEVESGYYYGFNAFSDFAAALNLAKTSTSGVQKIQLMNPSTSAALNDYTDLANTVAITADAPTVILYEVVCAICTKWFAQFVKKS